MYLDSETNIPVTFRWNRRRQLFLAEGEIPQYLPQDFLNEEKNGLNSDYFLKLVRENPLQYRISFRLPWSEELNVGWSEKSKIFMGEDTVEEIKFMVSMDRIDQTLQSLMAEKKE